MGKEKMFGLLFSVNFIVLNFISSSLSAQEKKLAKMDMSAYKKSSKDFFDKKIDKKFSPIEDWKCVGGEVFDLDKTHQPSVIYLGFYGCAPCRQAMPVYAQLSLDEKYRDYNFLYLTFDDSATISSEFLAAKITHQKIKTVSLPEKYIKEKGMALYFPVVYFLDRDKTVKMVYAYGELNGPLDSAEYWHSLLDSLK